MVGVCCQLRYNSLEPVSGILVPSHVWERRWNNELEVQNSELQEQSQCHLAYFHVFGERLQLTENFATRSRSLPVLDSDWGLPVSPTILSHTHSVGAQRLSEIFFERSKRTFICTKRTFICSKERSFAQKKVRLVLMNVRFPTTHSVVGAQRLSENFELTKRTFVWCKWTFVWCKWTFVWC